MVGNMLGRCSVKISWNANPLDGRIHASRTQCLVCESDVFTGNENNGTIQCMINFVSPIVSFRD